MASIGLGAFEDRQNIINRIKDYELIQLDSNKFESQNIIEFHVYGFHYQVQFLESDGSCKTHGKLLTDISSTSTSTSFGSLSFCKNKGLRGSISGFGLTLSIYPANYLLNPSISESFNLDDAYLVYKPKTISRKLLTDDVPVELKTVVVFNRNEVPTLPPVSSVQQAMDDALEHTTVTITVIGEHVEPNYTNQFDSLKCPNCDIDERFTKFSDWIRRTKSPQYKRKIDSFILLKNESVPALRVIKDGIGDPNKEIAVIHNTFKKGDTIVDNIAQAVGIQLGMESTRDCPILRNNQFPTCQISKMDRFLTENPETLAALTEESVNLHPSISIRGIYPYSGDYEDNGETVKSWPVYKMTKPDENKYLHMVGDGHELYYALSDDWKTNDYDSRAGKAGCAFEDPRNCTAWTVNSTTHRLGRTSGIYITDTDNGAFISDDELPWCFKESGHLDRLCLFGMGIGMEKDVLVLEADGKEGCLNEKAVYKGDGGFYLHFKEGKWFVSEGGVSDGFEMNCEREEIVECMNGMWKEWVLEESVWRVLEMNGTYIEDCGVEEEGKEEEREGMDVGIVVIGIVVGLCVCGIGGCLYWFLCGKGDKAKVAFDEESVEIEVGKETHTLKETNQ